MNVHDVIEILLGLIAFFGGMFVKGLNDSVKALHVQDEKLTDKIHSMETLVAGQYVKRDDFDKKMDALFSKLDTISEKLDGKVSKAEFNGQ